MARKKFTVTFRNDDDDHAAFLYLKRDNSGKLRLTPNGQATLKPGTLMSKQDITDNNGSVLYLPDLNKILSDEQIKGMKFGEGWESQCYEDAAHGHYWALTPKQEMTVLEGAYADLPIAHITVGSTNKQQATSLKVLYYNVEGLTGKGALNQGTAYFPISLRDHPGDQPSPSLSDKLDCSFVDGHEKDHDGHPNAEWILTSPPDDKPPKTNAFTLQIQPKAGESGVQAGADTTLILYFVSGDNAFNALASPEDISSIQLTNGAGAESWRITSVVDASSPYWKVVIPQGCELSGHLRFENVISRLEPGWTNLTLQYKGVPNYREGQAEIPVYKYGPPFMQYASASIVATYNESYGQHLLTSAKLTVQWACFSIEKMKVELINTSNSYRLITSDGGESGSIEYDVLDAMLADEGLDFGQGLIYFSIVSLAYPFPNFAQRGADWDSGYPFWSIGIDWKKVAEYPA